MNGPVLIWPYRGRVVAQPQLALFWQWGQVAVLNATAPLPSNFLTQGEPCRLDYKAPQAAFSPQAEG